MRVRSGYSLIELMAVVLLIGLAAGAVALRLDGVTDGTRLRSAARKLAAVVSLARTEAIRTGRSLWLHYDLDAGELSLVAATSDSSKASEAAKGSEASDKRRRIGNYRVPADVEVTGVALETGDSPEGLLLGHIKVRVLPNGFVAPHRVRLHTRPGRTGELRVDSLGDVRFAETGVPADAGAALSARGTS